MAFVRNRERLAAQGVRYPEHYTDGRAGEGDAVSGNGLSLLPLLSPAPEMTDEDGRRALAEVLDVVDASPQETVVYSSEMLFYFRPDRMAELRDALAARGVELWTLMYVRDIAGLVVSSYAQMVKRMRYTEPMSFYVGEYGNLPADMGAGGRLRILHDLLGPERVVVRHYDTDRKHLFDSLATEVLGIDDLSGYELVHNAVNRSLSPEEVEWMRHMNASLDSDLAAMIASDRITHRPALTLARPTIVRSDLDVLRGRFEDEVAWVNRHCFGTDRLSVEGSTPVVAAPDLPEVTQRERFLLDLLTDFANDEAARRRARKERRRAAAAAAAEAGDREARRHHTMRGAARRIRNRMRGGPATST